MKTEIELQSVINTIESKIKDLDACLTPYLN